MNSSIWAVWAAQGSKEKSRFEFFWAIFEGGFFNFWWAKKIFKKILKKKIMNVK